MKYSDSKQLVILQGVVFLCSNQSQFDNSTSGLLNRRLRHNSTIVQVGSQIVNAEA